MQPITFALVLPRRSRSTASRSRSTARGSAGRRPHGAVLRPRRLAARRALGHRQRDHRARRRDPQHALDRRPLPPHGDAQHRPLIFGAMYALLPELLGQGRSTARSSPGSTCGLTFVAGMAVFGIWLVQGLDGAPRRWAVLPSQYDTLTRISLPLVFVLAAAQALFFWNVLQTLRGKSGVATFDERGIPGSRCIVGRLVGARGRGRARAARAGARLHLRRRRLPRRAGARQGRRHCRRPRSRPRAPPSSATRRPARMSSRAPVAAAATFSRLPGRKAPSARRSTPRSHPRRW